MKIEHFWEPVTAEVKLCDDGVKRWVQHTRDGEEIVGIDDGTTISLAADTFEVGTKVSYEEPIQQGPASDG